MSSILTPSGRRALAAGDRPLQLAQLEVLQKRVRGREGREREAGRAVEEAEAQERAVEELPEDARGQKRRRPLPGSPLRLGGERRVTVELLEVVREVAVGAVKDGLVERFDRARRRGPSRERDRRRSARASGRRGGRASRPCRARRGARARGTRGGSARGRRRAETVPTRPRREAGANLEGELRRDDLVGVDREDPPVRRERGRRVLLPAEAVEGPHEDAGSRPPRRPPRCGRSMRRPRRRCARPRRPRRRARPGGGPPRRGR